MKRVLAISDTHCGQIFGLVPPEWQGCHKDPEVERIQETLWGFYRDRVKAIAKSSPTGKIDVLLSTGDGVDGKAWRNGGIEIIEPDFKEQERMYREVLMMPQADHVIGVSGTPYHVESRDGVGFEKDAVESVGGEFHDKAHVYVEGCQFDIRHKTSSSSIPHGRATAIMKEKLWSDLNAYEDEEERCDVLLRGHVHYHTAASGMSRGKRWWAMTLPSLQGSTKFGITQCLGRVDFGVTWFDIHEGRVMAWDSEVLPIFLKRTKIEIL